jgi:hypothetical protein
MDSNGQPISDKCMIDTIIGNLVTTKFVDSINEYIRKTELNNAVLKTVLITSVFLFE